MYGNVYSNKTFDKADSKNIECPMCLKHTIYSPHHAMHTIVILQNKENKETKKKTNSNQYLSPSLKAPRFLPLSPSKVRY